MGLDTLGEVPGRPNDRRRLGMRYFDADALEFLGDLRRHNDRTWFNEHKERYERALREPFLEFIADAGPELRTISKNLVADPARREDRCSASTATCASPRTRVPTRPTRGALPARGQGRPRTRLLPASRARRVLRRRGMWMPEPEVLQQIRQRIADKPSEWAKAHGKLDHSEETLKRPPRGSTRTIR